MEDLDSRSLPDIAVGERTVLGGFGVRDRGARGNVTSIALLPDQDAMAVAVAAVGAQEILLFSLEGELLARAGGSNDSPVAFGVIRQMQGARDGRLRVWDAQQSRVITLQADLSPAKAEQIDLASEATSARELVGFLPDGGFVMREEGPGGRMQDIPDGVRRDTVRLFRYSNAGMVRDTIAVLEGDLKWFKDLSGFRGYHDLIFGPDLKTLVVGDEVWAGSSRRFAFTRYGLRGEIRGRVNLSANSRPVSAQEIEDERIRRARAIPPDSDSSLAGGSPANRELFLRWVEMRREAVRDVPSHDTLPAYDRAVSGGGELVLLRQYPLPTEATVRWILIDRGGMPVGKVTLPRRAEIKAASSGLLVVLEGSVLEAQVIRVLELLETEAGS